MPVCTQQAALCQNRASGNRWERPTLILRERVVPDATLLQELATGTEQLKSKAPADSSTNDGAIPPFLKWAGGKRWLARRCMELFDTDYERYIEPFLGGASMFFALRPSKSILADCNKRLIETYIEVRRDPEAIASALRRYQKLHSDDFYYSERKRKYARSARKRVAQLIYLNRTCWNGLYRVNCRGEFNVPRGTKTSVVLDTDDFCAVASALEGAELIAQDFDTTLSTAGEGDLVYVDPPYTVKHNYNGFGKYNENIFSWEDQVRLKAAVAAAIERGAKVAVSNADHATLRDLYRGVGRLETIRRQSVISGIARHRGEISELLIRSWHPETE